MKSILNKTKIKLNSKINKISSKKQTKRKNNKSLKSVKRIQKGGIIDPDVFRTIYIKTKGSIEFERLYPRCVELITEFSKSQLLQPKVKRDGNQLQKVDFLNYKAKIKPTGDFERIFEDPLDWYKSKNPRFMHVNSIEIRVHEFRFMIAQMIKDLLLGLASDQMPQLLKHNGTINSRYDIQTSELLAFNMLRITDTLTKIEKNIEEGYLYIQFIEYMCDYIDLYNFFEKDKCEKWLLDLKKTLNTPFIILPTLVQVNFKKIINLIRAPLLNFRLSNSQQYVHSMYKPNCWEIYHDTNFHARKTHNIFFFELQNKYTPKELMENFPANYEIINDYFGRMYHLYNYDNYRPSYEESQNYMFSFLLYCIFHETSGISEVILNDTNIYDTLIEKLNEMSDKEEYERVKKTIEPSIPSINGKNKYDTYKESITNFIVELKKINETKIEGLKLLKYFIL